MCRFATLGPGWPRKSGQNRRRLCGLAQRSRLPRSARRDPALQSNMQFHKPAARALAADAHGAAARDGARLDEATRPRVAPGVVRVGANPDAQCGAGHEAEQGGEAEREIGMAAARDKGERAGEDRVDQQNQDDEAQDRATARRRRVTKRGAGVVHGESLRVFIVWLIAAA
ncbi:hypothetical protein PT2222_150166 [Paraburkholderia tropica]